MASAGDVSCRVFTVLFILQATSALTKAGGYAMKILQHQKEKQKEMSWHNNMKGTTIASCELKDEVIDNFAHGVVVSIADGRNGRIVITTDLE